MPPRTALPVIAAAGAFDAGGNAFLVLAAQAGRLDVAAVLSSFYSAMTVILAWIVLHERLGRVRFTGLVAALVAIALITSGCAAPRMAMHTSGAFATGQPEPRRAVSARGEAWRPLIAHGSAAAVAAIASSSVLFPCTYGSQLDSTIVRYCGQTRENIATEAGVYVMPRSFSASCTTAPVT